MMFERFEPAARQAFEDARAEAGRAGQDKIGSEHVLIGLLREPGPAADSLVAAGLDIDTLRARLPQGRSDAHRDIDPDALAIVGIDLDAVRRATDAVFGPGALDRAAATVPGRQRLRLADDAKRTLAGAVRQAAKLGQNTVSSGHMLIAILDQQPIDQPDNGALRILTATGTDVVALRRDVLRRIEQRPAGSKTD